MHRFPFLHQILPLGRGHVELDVIASVTVQKGV